MHIAVWIIAGLGAAVGAIELVLGIGASSGAPQEAAAAATACAFAVVPYVGARTWDELARKREP